MGAGVEVVPGEVGWHVSHWLQVQGSVLQHQADSVSTGIAALDTTRTRHSKTQPRVPRAPLLLCICCALPGAGGLGDTTLHHVYSDSTGTGELTASMKPGQHSAATAAAAAGPGLRAGSRRRSSMGRGRARASLAAETIPEETLTPQPPAAAPACASAQPEFEFSTGAGAASPQQQGDATGAAAAAVTPARGAGAAPGAAEGELTQDMDMDISLNLGGATPGLLGDSHLTPLVQQGGWRHAQQTPLQQQQLSQFEVVPESPEGGAAAGPAPDGGADLMDVDGIQPDENAPPASPGGGGASPAGAAAAGGEVDGLTTNLLLDDHRQLPGWGHVPLGERASLGGAGGGLTTHTGRGSVGSNVLTMHTVGCALLCCAVLCPLCVTPRLCRE